MKVEAGHTGFERQLLELAEPEGAAELRSGHDVERATWTGIDDRARAREQVGREPPMRVLIS